MSDHRALVSLSQCLQLADAASELDLDGGPWTDQQWMHDRLAVSDNCLTLFPLAPGVHQVELFVHARCPDFSGRLANEPWAHVVEASWTFPDEVVSSPSLLSTDEGKFDVELPAEACRICWRLGWFDPELMDEEAPWGTLRGELHIWPAQAGPVDVTKLWGGEVPELPDPPPLQAPMAASIMGGCAVFGILFTILVLIPAGLIYLVWLGIRTLLQALGVL